MTPDMDATSEITRRMLTDFDTITVDRYPVPGIDGGSYRHGNIRPACGTCNSRHGNALRWSRAS